MEPSLSPKPTGNNLNVRVYRLAEAGGSAAQTSRATFAPVFSVARVCVVITVALSLLVPALASAQSIEMEIFLPSEDDPDEKILIPEGDIRIERFFNQARCLCESEFDIEFFAPNLESIPESRPIEVWIGTSCDDQELQLTNCGSDPFHTFGDRNELDSKTRLPIMVNDLVDPINGECGDTEDESRIYSLVDQEGDGTYEVNDSIGITTDLNPPPELTPIGANEGLDEGEIKARGSEGGFVVSWQLPDTRQSDFEFFQVLCSREDGSMALDSPSNDALYETTDTICGDGGDGIDGLNEQFICGEETVPGNSIRVSDLPNDESYRVVLVAIDGARNPTAVNLGVVTPEPVIDFWEDYQENGGLAEGGYCFVATAAYGDYSHPQVVVLREFRDSVMMPNVVGRALVSAYYWASPPIADVIAQSSVLRFVTRVLLAPVVAMAGMWVYSGLLGKLGLMLVSVLGFGLLRRRRRRRRSRGAINQRGKEQPRSSGANQHAGQVRGSLRGRRRFAIAATASIATLILLSQTALAQQEYLDELYEDDAVDFNAPEAVTWNFELRFAPFFPDVDSEFSDSSGDFGSDGGPFERMFGGGPMLMTQLTLDRFFTHPEGQLGISFSLGFLTTGADAFQFDPDAMDNIARDPRSGKPLRVDGERTDFRLYPTSVSAVYRYTGLDDHFSVPIVPYGRAGLAYTLWTISRPDGTTSEVSTSDCMVEDPESDCKGNRGRGGSFGYVGALGIALRAERIDADAAVSLRNELGIEHAGFFIEGNLSKVNGFGSDSKLSVGDLTWFGGINFEF